MNKSEIKVIENVIRHLEKDNNRCSEAVKQTLNEKNLRCYLDTWVIPAMRLLIDEQRTTYDLTLAVELSS